MTHPAACVEWAIRAIFHLTSGAARGSGPGNLGGHPKVPVLPVAHPGPRGPRVAAEGDVASARSGAGNEVSGAERASVTALPGVFFEEGEDAVDFDTHPENHHLWRNGRLWWVAFTVHLPTWQKERVRVSLGTEDVAEARRRRDALFQSYPDARGATLSLRLAPARRSGMRQVSPAAAAGAPSSSRRSR